MSGSDVIRLAHHIRGGFLGDEVRQPFPEHLVIFHQDDADGGFFSFRDHD
jgi:hypothetical protein